MNGAAATVSPNIPFDLERREKGNKSPQSLSFGVSQGRTGDGAETTKGKFLPPQSATMGRNRKCLNSRSPPYEVSG